MSPLLQSAVSGEGEIELGEGYNLEASPQQRSGSEWLLVFFLISLWLSWQKKKKKICAHSFKTSSKIRKHKKYINKYPKSTM